MRRSTRRAAPATLTALASLATLAVLAASFACGDSDSAAKTNSAAPASSTAKATSSATSAPKPSAPGGAPSPAIPLTPALSLAPDQVAVIDGEIVLTEADLDTYLATVYARLPEGDDAQQQLVTEAVIDAAATAAAVTASEDEIAALETRLERQVREASGGKHGLQESLGQGVTPQDLHSAMRLQVLHEKIVRHELGLAPDARVDPAQLKTWIDAHLPGAALEALPLDDPLAARWPGGQLTKQQVGRRLRSVLSPRDVSGVLTELIGVQLVRREAARLGVALTPAAATQEILDRNAVLKEKAGIGDVSYDQFVETVQKRSLSGADRLRSVLDRGAAAPDQRARAGPRTRRAPSGRRTRRSSRRPRRRRRPSWAESARRPSRRLRPRRCRRTGTSCATPSGRPSARRSTPPVQAE